MKNSAVKAMLQCQYPDADKIEVKFLYRIGDKYSFEVYIQYDDTDTYRVDILEIVSHTVREESTF